jgi:REP-associated tyrosine transposase
MAYDPKKHHRGSIRLKGYDYSQPGPYFITLVAYQRRLLFGEIDGNVMRLNRNGEIVSQTWRDLPRHYAHVKLDAFVVMPNHVHGIVVLNPVDGRGGSCQGLAKYLRWKGLPYVRNF